MKVSVTIPAEKGRKKGEPYTNKKNEKGVKIEEEEEEEEEREEEGGGRGEG